LSTWWTVSYVVLWAIVVMLAIVVVALARQIGTLHLRLGPRGALEMDDEGPALGDAPPPRDALDIDGRDITVGGPGRSQLLLFVSPGCMVCVQVLPAVPVLARTYGLEAIALSEEDAIETRRELGRYKDVRIVAGHAHFQAYEIPGTPFAVVLDELGIVRGKGTVNNLEQFEGLIATAARREAMIRDEAIG
jgi:methylamine dehydrogenase accessory protein MauD